MPLSARVIQWILIDQAKADNKYVSSIITDRPDPREIFLASSVINIEIYVISFMLRSSLIRVDHSRGNTVWKPVLAVCKQQRGLADTSVSDDDDLYLVPLNNAELW
jgi:hypothetical protein